MEATHAVMYIFYPISHTYILTLSYMDVKNLGKKELRIHVPLTSLLANTCIVIHVHVQ